MNRDKQIAISIFVITVLGFAVFANTLSGEFLWDDQALIVNNDFIKDWSYLGSIFLNPLRGNTATYRFYRPLFMVTLLLDYQLWK